MTWGCCQIIKEPTSDGASLEDGSVIFIQRMPLNPCLAAISHAIGTAVLYHFNCFSKDLLYSKAHNENYATLPFLNEIYHTMYYKSDRFQQEGNFALPATGANIETAQPDAPKAKHGDPYRKKNQ